MHDECSCHDEAQERAVTAMREARACEGDPYGNGAHLGIALPFANTCYDCAHAVVAAVLRVHGKAGPNRVRAWIHSALNPLIDMLTNEQAMLERGDLRWQFDGRACEFIVAPERYLSDSGRLNLRDFVRCNPAERDLLARHGERLASLLLAASDAYDDVRGAEAGQRSQVGVVLNEAESHHHHLSAIAAAIVNSRTGVGLRPDLFALRSRPAFARLDAEAAAMATDGAELVAALDARRTALAEEYDVAIGVEE